MQEKMNNQSQYALSIKKCLFYKKRLFYIAPTGLLLSLFLVVGFQNCAGKNSQTLPQVIGPDPIAELPIKQTKHADLLEISASIKGQVQDDFAVESIVDMKLTPSDHKNLQGDKSFYWTIEDNYAWATPFYGSCSITTQYCENDLCNTTSCEIDPNPPVHEDIATKTPSVQYEFLDVGVYDIYTEIREGIPSAIEKNPNGPVIQGGNVYGPRYEKSLVIGKCDSDNLHIINAKDPIKDVKSSTQSVNSLTNDHLSYVYKSSQTSRYASIFMLELNGEILELEPPYYGYINYGYTKLLPSVPPSIDGENDVADSNSEYLEERKVSWKLTAEMVDPTYGRWYNRFDEQTISGAWYMPWPEDNVHYFYNNNGITSETTFSGKFILEAFVQLPGEECIHSTKKAFQLPSNLVPSIENYDIVVKYHPNDPQPRQTPTPTTITTQSSSIAPSTTTSTAQGL